jgi:pSer/pThr/pTyr-binding forkhead associated (FHA) protein
MENRSPGGGADPEGGGDGGGGGGGGTVPRGAPIEKTVKAEKEAIATSEEVPATASAAPMQLPPTDVKDEDVAMADAPELPAAKQGASEDDSSSLLEKKADSTQSPAPAAPEVEMVDHQHSADGATNAVMTTLPAPVPNSADSAPAPPPPPPPPPRDATPPPTASLPDNQDMLEFATPTQSSRDIRNTILAAQSAQSTNMFMQGSVPPSPVVEPGALHELGDIHTPNRRRSSAAAIGGIAGLEELIHRKEGDGQSRFDQLIQATKIEGEGDEKPTPVVDAFLRLDFEDGNVYYIRNPSVVFGRAEGASAGYYSHVGPDGSTIIETGPTGFGTTTSSGLTSIRREKKKRKKKKSEFDLMRKTKSSTSDSCAATPGSSRRGSEFALPCFRDPFGLDDIFGVEEPVIHLPLSNSSLGDNAPAPPRKNISRRHARLFYNTPKRRFELEIMGKNGAFVDEEYVTAGSTIVVEEKGMKVQIGGISFNVIVPELRHIEDITPATKPIGGKGKMSFSFHDENGNEVSTNFSGEDDDVAMEDEDEEMGSDEESENGSREQSEDDEADDEDNEAEDEADSAEEAEAKDPDSSELSSMEEVSAFPSPEPVSKRGRGRPKKSIADIQRREKELQRDREKIRVLQRQLKEKEKEKAQAEAEAAKREREDQRTRKREREKEKEREKERDKEKEKLRDEQKKKKATDLQRQKEARQKEKELAKLAKEKEREREKERKKQAKLHLPTGNPKKEDAKLHLPATTKNPAQIPQQQESKPGTMLLQASSSTDSTPGPQLQTQTQQQFAQPLQQSQHQAQYQAQPQTYAPAPSVIDPALYETSAPPMTSAPYTQIPLPEKQKKEKAPAKQKKLRSPSPDIKESDIPPEALQKPNISYVVMIHEAILNSQERMLSLPQIYKTIETKYPYYKFKVTTNGWQSSVRHNLGQHKAFYKVDRAGKGWLWGVVDGISIEKEKKGSVAKQAIPVGYDMSAMHNGQRVIQHPNGQMAGLQTGAGPQGYQQQPVYHNETNGVAQQQYQTNQDGMTPHQPMQQPNAYPQHAPPMPSYMPQKQPQQSASQPNHRAFEAPIPKPVASGSSQSQMSEQKPDAKQVISLLSKIIAQRQDQSSTDANANKGLEQLKEFLNQLVSGRANPAALETVTSLVNSYKQPVASKALASSTPPQPSATSPPPPACAAGAAAQASPPPPAQATVTSPPPLPPVQGQTPGKAPAQAPATKVTLANLHEHIKTMSPEERAKWTKKLLELKQQKAAAAAAAKSPTPPQPAGTVYPQPTAVGNAPVPAGKAPSGLGAGKHPQKMTPEMVQQILKLRASHAQKRPAPPAGEGDQQGPVEKKVDVGARKE